MHDLNKEGERFGSLLRMVTQLGYLGAAHF